MRRFVTSRSVCVGWMVAFGLLFGWSTSSAQTEQIHLAWDASSGSIGGYKLYYGTSSRNYTTFIDVGNTTSHTVNLDLSQHHYFFAVTAYDPPRTLESGYSNEVTTAPQMEPDKSPMYNLQWVVPGRW